MKKILFSLLALCILGSALAQSAKCGIDTKALVREEIAAGATSIGFLAKMQPNFDRDRLEKAGITIGAQAGQIVTLHVPVESLDMLESNREIIQYSIAHRVGSVTMDNTRRDTRTDKVQAGEGVSNSTAYDGQGVYIGITDWGFDYTHPNYNYGTNNKRVVRAWDQYRRKGPAPDGFDYGTEIIGYTALRTAKGDTSNIYNYNSHGTHVAGICAGAGTSRQHKFRGQAPGAELLFCSFGLNEVNWMEAVQWMINVAKDDGRRLVINSSWGMYSLSCIDGMSLLSQAINSWSDSGVVFVTSAGNNGDVNFHISRDFSVNPDTLKTVATFYTLPANATGQCLILWGETGHNFSAGIRMRKNANVWSSTMFNTENGDTIFYDTLVCDNMRVPYRVLMERINPQDSRPHIQIDVDGDGTLQLQLFVAADSGIVHAWNVVNKSNHAGNEGADFYTGNHSGFSGGDRYYGIGEPACAEKAISVAAHKADTSDERTGILAEFSSYGPTIDGSQKPEISAPGYMVNSSISLWCDQYHSYTPTAHDSIGLRDYTWSLMSGTSMSSPAVTGIVALLLQANPELTVDQIREIIFTTARNDDKTGPLRANDSADLRWGWGKIDALAAINKAISLVDIREVEELRLPLNLYPNPTNNNVTINTGCGEKQLLQVYNISGSLVLETPISTETTLDVSHWAKGVYIVRIGSRTEKLIVH
ncbi:MAG: S8 family peptidase [Bacteroidales bacterium]|nr:S8 family peptidase [Bacteroidales bacterium]